MRNYIANRVQRVPPSGIREFFDIAATMPDVISLGIGEPDFTSPADIRQAAIASLERGQTAYTSNSGLYELREAIAAYVARLYGASYDPNDEVLITVGVSEGMYLAMSAFIDPGDEVIIPEPAYVSYAPEVIFAEGNPVLIPTCAEDDFQVSPEALEAAVTPHTKAVLIGYPNNPTGGVLSYERMLALAAIAQKYDLIVISDEIYDRLVYGVQHIQFATLPDMRERAVVLSGFSKSHAMTGWRLGYAVGPKNLIGAMRKIHQYTIMSAPTVAQYAALEGLQNDDEVLRMRDEYNRRRHLVYTSFNQMGLPCFEPKGAFYAFPSIVPTGLTDFEFSRKLIQEEQVAVIPGSAFGPSGAGHVRVCYANSYDNLEEALTRIDRFVKHYL
ncbi:MAG: aminotransferase class I/II-fold pyridoxal phosphate-dependent enzyme [Anaerolineae bacterium]|jgi:aminotransferase|nr:MAG: aminotransferase class I/II-fold pyridoxal phosphate-dependent enzyme [Anaerolineae bacterium]